MCTPNKSMKKTPFKCGKKILGQAIDGFYYFEDDDIENFIEKAMVKFEGVHQPPLRKYIWSNEMIRNKIISVGLGIYG